MTEGTPQRPLVSIVINNFNYGRFVGEAIASALAQTYAPCEVVVVDDGSTDDSRTVIGRFADRVIPVFQENGGQGAAMNAGFARSRGDLVLFLDADDILEPEAVARSVSLFGPGVDRVQFALRFVNEKGETLGAQFPAPGACPSGSLRDRVLRGPIPDTPPTSGNVFSRRVLEAILPMPEPEWRICADGYLLIVSALYGQVASTDEPLGRYRVHRTSNWSAAGLSVDALLKLFQNEERKLTALRSAAAQFGYGVSEGWPLENPTYVDHRLYMLVHHPERHPFAQDTVAGLAARAARVAWSAGGPRARAAAKALFYGALPVLPSGARRALMEWKLIPASRPWARSARAS